MATSIDIVNQALAQLGNKANVASIDPPDGTAEAGWASRFYSSSVYRGLEHHDWSFARKRATLNLVDNPSASGAWLYAYQKPADCLAARRILTGDATQFEDDSEPFSVEGTTILTNKQAAVLVYTAPVADAALFTPAFGDVVAAELAAFLAGPVLRGAEGVKAMGDLRKLAMQLAADAAAQDARNERRPSAEQQFTPASVKARA